MYYVLAVLSPFLYVVMFSMPQPTLITFPLPLLSIWFLQKASQKGENEDGSNGSRKRKQSQINEGRLLFLFLFFFSLSPHLPNVLLPWFYRGFPYFLLFSRYGCCGWWRGWSSSFRHEEKEEEEEDQKCRSLYHVVFVGMRYIFICNIFSYICTCLPTDPDHSFEPPRHPPFLDPEKDVFIPRNTVDDTVWEENAKDDIVRDLDGDWSD